MYSKEFFERQAQIWAEHHAEREAYYAAEIARRATTPTSDVPASELPDFDEATKLDIEIKYTASNITKKG